MNTVEKMGLIWEADSGLSVLGNISLWLMRNKVIMGPSRELTSEGSFKVESRTGLPSGRSQPSVAGLWLVHLRFGSLIGKSCAGWLWDTLASWLFNGLLGSLGW